MSGIPRGGGLPRRGDGGADRDRENTNAAGGTRRPASSGTSGTGRTAGGGATGGGAASGTSGTGRTGSASSGRPSISAGTSSARGTAASGGGAGGRTGQTGPVMHSSRGGMQAAQARAETPALQRGPQAGATSSANLTSPLAGTPPLKRKDREFDGKNMDDAETNITVVVRCRGRNPKEILANSGVSLHTPGGLKGNQVVLETGAGAMSNKTYTFDRVFPPEADQAMIYDDAIHPIVQEMLAGYNCTIFAYGQTGTGKTYTMAGDMKENDGLVSERAGIIPRTLHNLFSQLEADGSEYTVKCSYLELYNEELRDLQGPINERKEVKIFDDKRGHGVIIQGMEERFIKTAEEGGEILLAGGKRRETQATNCNDLSSRSHTVFTIVVHARVQTAEGEDILRTGKLNLVDLAGSENIGRSGAENKRAREAGMINQSLLTLGRVINHLVDKSQHIPYRESKLTRLLQDSLGGRTKTCIIATISPNKDSLEETMSTLDYAARAKNIRNKPQVNQLVAKKALIKEYVLEIERLKGDLVAARQKNGVYMTDESFRDFTEQSESRRIQVEEQERKIELLTIRATKAAEELREKLLLLNASKKELQDVKDTLEGAMMQLKETTEELQNTKISLREETLLRRAHEKTEGQLDAVGTTMIKSLDQAVSDIDTLLDKVRRGEENEAINKHTWLESSKQVGNVLTRVGDNIDVVAKDHDELTRIVNVTLNKHLNSERTKLTSTYDLIESGLKIFSEKGEELLTDTEISKEQMIQVLEGIKELREEVKARVGEGLQGLGVATERIANEVVSEMAQFQEALHASFSGRGRDFKLAFDSTKKHLNAQKEEIDSLRARLAEAHAQSLAASATATQSLDAILKEERENAARDRAELVEQLTAVLNANANKQNDRLTARIATVQNAIETSGKQLSGVSDEFKEGMENWEKTEDTFMEVLINNREDLKTKLVQDWEQADDYSRRIQVTTRSVHAESVKLVDEQIREVDVQMRSLDQYVTKAKAEYEGHHERFTNTFGNLVSTVDRKFGDTLSTIHGVRNDIQKFGSDMDQSVGSLQKFIPTIVANAQEPLNELRLYMSNAEFKTTAETGNTPHKRKYEYPDKLPRTQPHEVLLEKLRAGSSIPNILNGNDTASQKQRFGFDKGTKPQLNTEANVGRNSRRAEEADDEDVEMEEVGGDIHYHHAAAAGSLNSSSNSAAAASTNTSASSFAAPAGLRALNSSSSSSSSASFGFAKSSAAASAFSSAFNTTATTATTTNNVSSTHHTHADSGDPSLPHLLPLDQPLSSSNSTSTTAPSRLTYYASPSDDPALNTAFNSSSDNTNTNTNFNFPPSANFLNSANTTTPLLASPQKNNDHLLYSPIRTLRQQQAARQQQKLLAAQQSQSPMPSIATALFTAGGGALPPPPQPTLAAIKSLKELNPNVDVGHYHRATSVDPPTDTGSLLDMQPPLKKQDLGERGAGASGIGGGAGGGAGGAGGSGAAVAEKKTRSGRGYRGGMENSSMIGGMPGSAGKGRRNARNP